MSKTAEVPKANTNELSKSIDGKELLGECTWHELRELAEKTVKKNNELGVQVILSPDKERKRILIHGTSKNIQAPPLKGKVAGVIFFHTHPPFSGNHHFGYEKNNPLQILPSHESDKFLQTSGDFTNTRGLQWGYEKGGYLNIATQDGVTLAVGTVAISDSDKVLSEIRRKQGLQNKLSPATWKVWTGPSAGESFSNVLEFAKTGKPLAGEEGSALISFTDYLEGTQIYLLRLNWTLIEKLGISLDQICFGNGVELLVEQLGLQQFPHQENLDKVNKIRIRPERDYRIRRLAKR